RLPESDVDRRIAGAVLYGVERPFAWWVGPGGRPLNLEDRLRDYGPEATEYQLGMAMELWDPPQTREPGRPHGSACDVRWGIHGLRRRICCEVGTAPTQPYLSSTGALPQCCFKTNVR